MTEQTRRILVVDDEEPVRNAFRDALCPVSSRPSALDSLESELFGSDAASHEESGFDVCCASQGEEAIAAVQRALDEENPFGVAFVDIRMPPGIDGVEAAVRIRALDPLINIVVVTGYSDTDVSEMARRILPADKLFFIAKPLQVFEIRQQAAALSARWTAESEMIGRLRSHNEHLQEAIADAKTAKEAALEASHAKSQFISNVSHELRTPLNAIIGFSAMIGSEVHGPIGDERYVDYAKEIDTAGHGLLKSINEIIDTARLDLGNLRFQMEEFDLQTALEGALAQLDGLAKSKRISWELRGADHCCPVVGDSKRVLQILVAVAHNAVKFSPDGSSVQVVVDAQDRYVRVSISDRGPGISREVIETMQRPFIQDHNVLTKTHGGLGLGLWLSRRLIEAQGGHLTVSPREGGGSVVSLDFQAARPVTQAA